MYSSHFSDGNNRLGFADTHDELDWLLTNSNCLVLFYDKKQIVSPCGISYCDFYNRLNSEFRGIRPVELCSQMRILAGENYVPYIFDVLKQKSPKPIQFKNYDLRLFSSMSNMLKQLQQKETEYGLCRLCSGYAWKWAAKNSPATPDIHIDGVDIWWNKQTSGWLKNEAAKNDMGSVYSLPGLDLNYAAVVIGPDLYYDSADNTIKVNKAGFFDNKVKRSVTDDELKDFIINTYALFLTRSIYGTYVYVCDDALRVYMSKYIFEAE